MHAHGGGFVLNDVDVHDGICRRMANRGRRAVLSVDYRRPPEAPFPAAPDDLDTVVGWLRREGARSDLAGPYAADGDSAGANLALVAALRNPGFFTALALIYPFLDPRCAFPSWDEARDTGFDPAEAHWYWEQYARSEADFDDPDLAPLLSDRLHTLPPTFVASAEADPLRDEGESSPASSPRQGWRRSASAASAIPTASGGTPSSPPRSRWCARWPGGSTSTSRGGRARHARSRLRRGALR